MCTQRLLKPLGRCGKYGEHGESCTLTGGMLQGEVLDIHAGGAHVGEEPSELAGGVRHEDLDLGVAARRATVLAGNAGPPGITATHDVGDGAHRSRNDGICALGERALRRGTREQCGSDTLDEEVEIGAYSPQQLCHRLGIADDDRRPQARVGGGDTGGVAQSLTGESQGGLGQLL